MNSNSNIENVIYYIKNDDNLCSVKNLIKCNDVKLHHVVDDAYINKKKLDIIICEKCIDTAPNKDDEYAWFASHLIDALDVAETCDMRKYLGTCLGRGRDYWKAKKDQNNY